MDIIQSSSGKRMFGYISPIYYSSRVFQTIYEKVGREVDDLYEWIPDIRKQLFPQTATWGLVYWEDLLGLPIDENKSYQERRYQVSSKIQQRWPITVERMERIISSTSGEITATIIQNVADYTFRVEFRNDGEPLNLIKVANVINETKPAHLSYQLCIIYDTDLAISMDYKRHFFRYPICGTYESGTHPDIAGIGRTYHSNIGIDSELSNTVFRYPLAGTKPIITTINKIINVPVNIEACTEKTLFRYPTCGTYESGTHQEIAIVGRTYDGNIGIGGELSSTVFNHPVCGTLFTGTYPKGVN